jgi:CDP-glucose 4,6-dehydratase
VHYLITGHTGFKGAWLTLLLTERGHTVSGISLDPVPGALYQRAGLSEILQHDLRVDIRDASALASAVKQVSPDVVLHLAAQALVRESYREPRVTFETNVMGTLNLLEAVSRVPSIRANVVITTDKVYRNVNQVAGYVESDPLGGDDPYSSSKAMADLLTQSWVTSFPGVPTAIARAGNVIGGGDVSVDRLLPDLVAAYASRTGAQLRYPDAVRPWQHVLDCLNGYLTLVDALLAGFGLGEWNFGPGVESFVSVGDVASLVAEIWGEGASWERVEEHQPHEANLLALSAEKAERVLNWKNRLGFGESLKWSVDWYKAIVSGSDPRQTTVAQVRAFEGLA